MMIPLLTGCPEEEESPSYTWSEAFPAFDVGWFLSVAGSSGDDLYAVGGAPTAGVIYQYDGKAWTEVEHGLDLPLMNWVHSLDSDTAVMVGNAGTIVRVDQGTWTLEDSGTDQDLWGVWGESPDDLWAVGGQGRSDGQQTVLRFQNGAWTDVTPTLERPGVFAFFKVWGTSASDVFIVGQRGAILHWNGTELVEQSAGTSDDLIALWGVAPDRIVAVGGRNNGVIAIYDGTEWTSESLAPLPGLNGIWMRNEARAHVAGNNGTLGIVDLETLDVATANITTDLAFHAVFGDSDNTLTGVGGNFMFANGPYNGIVYSRTMTNDD